MTDDILLRPAPMEGQGRLQPRLARAGGRSAAGGRAVRAGGESRRAGCLAAAARHRGLRGVAGTQFASADVGRDRCRAGARWIRARDLRRPHRPARQRLHRALSHACFRSGELPARSRPRFPLSRGSILLRADFAGRFRHARLVIVVGAMAEPRAGGDSRSGPGRL